VYPFLWKDRAAFEPGGPALEISDREKEWANLLLTFAEATYSDNPT
jgi:hypothetical protein